MHSNNGILAEARGTLCVSVYTTTECLANVGRIVTISVNHKFWYSCLHLSLLPSTYYL